MNQPLTQQDIEKIFANPFYCLPQIPETFVHEHQPMVTEEEFIKVGAILIREIGPEKYLQLLLDNLKGNYAT